MTTTLTIPVKIVAVVHEIEGGGYWAEVPRLPGCVAQAETLETLKENIVQAVEDWLPGPSVITEHEARQLAQIQGNTEPFDQSFPQPIDYQPPAGWNDDDE
jgi:predicted RNase H-like HicB family nuclease